MPTTYWKVSVRTGFESHRGQISVAVLVVYLAMLSLCFCLASIAEGDSIINATLLSFYCLDHAGLLFYQLIIVTFQCNINSQLVELLYHSITLIHI